MIMFFSSVRNRAIADYLRSNGYEEAYSTFKKEAELDMVRNSRSRCRFNQTLKVWLFFLPSLCFLCYRMKK